MPARRLRRRARAWVASLGAVAAMVATAGPGFAAPDGPAEDAVAAGLYVVTFADAPVAMYAGGVEGYAATEPRGGRRFDNERPEVTRYRARLVQRQDAVLEQIGDPDPVYRYTTVVSGVAVDLTSAQVEALRAAPGVLAVERETTSDLDTVDSPAFLGLTGASGTWAVAGGADNAGRGTVIGVIDSGVWPENPSFSGPDLPSGERSLRLFAGLCQTGERWSGDDCNQKIVAARWFVDGFGRDRVAAAEYLSARDFHGHGSHVASIAAGNRGVRVVIDGEWMGNASGMAPGAAVAAYKACWAAPNPTDDGCSSADTLRAFDQAVADGVDVLSYAVSGPAAGGPAMQRAFRSAAAAGVVVVASAGNGGRRGVTPSSPWVTTVAASTYRLFQGAAVLGDGTRLVGAMVSGRAVPPSSVVLGADAAVPGTPRRQAARCEAGSLAAADATGRVVVCERGVNARVDKSRAVGRAGGVAMVLVNTIAARGRDVDADVHAVPTVHLDRAHGRALRRYLRSAGGAATVALDPRATDDTEVPRVAGFSGSGPADDQDILKPDLTAPGVSVLAAAVPPTDAGRNWDVMSGTSMAAAHVAGLAALARAEHPGWSPTAVKSAMMTTAYDVAGRRKGLRPSALRQGAGHVDPTRFLDPGLVYRPTPSISVPDLVGVSVVRRTVTNVSGRAETFNASVRGLRGIDASVVPATMRLRPGESQTFRVRLVAERGARFGRFVSGSLTWNGTRGHAVRIPVTVRAERLAAPDGSRGVGVAGAVRLAGTGGMTGRVRVRVAGLVGAAPQSVVLAPGRFDPRQPAASPSAHLASFSVPRSTAAVRFDAVTADDADDLDIYVYRGGELIARETGPDGDAQITIVRPAAGRYDVYTHLRRAAGKPSATALFTGWVVPRRDTGTLDVPRSVLLAGDERFSVRASWRRLDSSQRWFGLVTFGGGDDREATPVAVH